MSNRTTNNTTGAAPTITEEDGTPKEMIRGEINYTTSSLREILLMLH